MKELFKTVETAEDLVIVKADVKAIRFIGKDSDGAILRIYASESDAIAIAKAILEHFGIHETP